MLNEVPVKKEKIKTSHEYALLEKLKKLASLYTCPVCDYNYYCCDRCGESNGYLAYKIEGESYVETPHGFLEEGKGCTLPVRLRSVTCMTHICEERRKTMDKEALDGLDGLIQVMRRLEHQISVMETS